PRILGDLQPRRRAPLEAEPLFREVNPGPDADYLVTLRLLTVAPPPAPPTPILDPTPRLGGVFFSGWSVP
ncbi:hypothetical protein ACG3QZ_15845, partial [Pseudomonas aeruginosa]